MKRCVKSIIRRMMIKRGYSSYYAQRLINYIISDFFCNKNTTLKEKIWAYKRGFLSSKIKVYGLNDQNYKSFLSDFDYYKLYPLNNNYKKWVDDKLTTKYVLYPFSEHLTKYYFHINDCKKILSLKDLSSSDYDGIEGIVKLLDQERNLAFKPEDGSRGEGFYKLSLEDGKYSINNDVIKKEEMVDFISGLKNYLITEYVIGHHSLSGISLKSLNTIRVMVIRDSDTSWIIANAYIRFGTNGTGVVDNVSAGGMFSLIDVDSGSFSGAKMIKNDNSVHDYKIHPDTKIKIEGIIPDWATVKNKIIEMCKYLSELNYLGFDIAITEDGFKVIEINSHQNIRAFQIYSPLLANNRASKYFNRLLESKKM